MNRVLAAAAVLLATSAAHADTVRSLERGTAYAGQSKSNKSLTIPTHNGSITLRSDGGEHGMIGVEHTFSATGYFLQKDGKLSANDRARLEASLAKDNVSRADVVHGVRSSMLRRRVYEAKLATMDGKVDAILADARLGRARSYNQNVSFEAGGPSGAMILVNESWSQRAIFLEGSKDRGYSLSPGDRADVARLLLK